MEWIHPGAPSSNAMGQAMGGWAMIGNCDMGSALLWSDWSEQVAWMLLLLLGAGLISWYLVKKGNKTDLSADKADSLRILKLRLVRGDITIDEYFTLKNFL